MNNFKEQALKIKKKSLETNYKYKYFIFDEKTNNIISLPKDSSRKTFEEFRKENSYSFSYAGEVSYREFFKDNKLVGFVLEDKVKTKDNLQQEIKDLYKKALDSFIENFNIKDLDNFEYFLENENFSDFGFTSNNIDFYLQKINFLNDLSTKYKNDLDFKLFFDKIIK
jgi:hypothetical protein